MTDCIGNLFVKSILLSILIFLLFLIKRNLICDHQVLCCAVLDISFMVTVSPLNCFLLVQIFHCIKKLEIIILYCQVNNKPSPIALEPLNGQKAAVLSLLVQLPCGDEDYTPSNQSGLAIASALVSLGMYISLTRIANILKLSLFLSRDIINIRFYI